MTLAAFHRLCPECGSNSPTGRDGFCNACRCRYADEEPDAATILIRDLYQLVHQYRNDLLYPPAADSRERRIAAIDAALAREPQHG